MEAQISVVAHIKRGLLASLEVAKANYTDISHFLFRHSPAHPPDGFGGYQRVPV